MVCCTVVQVGDLRSVPVRLLSARKIRGLILIDHQLSFSLRRFKVLKISVENIAGDFKCGIGVAALRPQTQTAAQTFRTGFK